MLSDICGFINDANNRTILGWIGGGLVIVISGIWAVVTFLLKKKRKTSAPTPRVSSTQGGVAAGRDIRDSTIDTRGG